LTSIYNFCIPRQVFDVTRGRKHYGPGGGYSFFAGRDGSAAFVSGAFNETGALMRHAAMAIPWWLAHTLLSPVFVGGNTRGL
jgi:Cytochrome b5-like Heme/Steroid binding domain